MTQVMPIRLRKSPLLEAIFEMRFVPVVEGAGDVLPGLIFGTLRSKYSRIEQLPVAAVPRAVRASQDALVYQPSHRLHGSEAASIQLGDRVAAVTSTSYPGWVAFRSMALELVEVIGKTGMIKTVERLSLRYTNVLTSSKDREQLPLLNIHVELVGRAPSERGFLLRTETDEGDITSTVQIAPNATAKLATSVDISGLLVDIDTVIQSPSSTFLSAPVRELEKVHDAVKKTFFSLLTKEAIAELDPE